MLAALQRLDGDIRRHPGGGGHHHGLDVGVVQQVVVVGGANGKVVLLLHRFHFAGGAVAHPHNVGPGGFQQGGDVPADRDVPAADDAKIVYLHGSSLLPRTAMHSNSTKKPFSWQPTQVREG